MSIISAKPKTTRFYLLATLVVAIVGVALGILLQIANARSPHVELPASLQQRYAAAHDYPLDTWGKVAHSHRLLTINLTKISVNAVIWPKPTPLPAFTLTDKNGNVFDKSALKGRWSLLFIGFTYCPDICPPTLSVMDKVGAKLGDKAPQLLFISVDPQRDTPAALKAYLKYFSTPIQGATGTTDQLKHLLTDSMYMPFELGKPDEHGNYSVDHSGNIMIINPQAELAGFFRPPLKSELMVNDMRQIMLAMEKPQPLRSRDGFVRLGVPTAPSAAGYISLTNQSNEILTLVSGESPAYRVIEFHKMVESDGMLRMRRIPQIEIKPGEQFDFKTGAEHIMLIGRKKMLSQGELLPITLTFSNGDSQTFQLPVKILQQ